MKKTLLKSLALAVVGSLCAIAAANAAMLEGGISMTGTFTPVVATTVNGITSQLDTTIADSTGIDFGGWIDSLAAADNTFLVTTADGSFTELVGNFSGIINDFQFEPFIATNAPFWSVGGFSFEMTSLTMQKDLTPGHNQISVFGLGMLSATGFENTPGVWNFTGQGVNNANFSWSASTGAEPVPEPATMLLFGTGLIGLAGVGRKLRK